MAKIQIQRGEFEQAKTLCQNALTTYESIFDENHPKLKPVLEALIFLYEQQADHLEAEKLALRIETLQQPQQITTATVAKESKLPDIADKEPKDDFQQTANLAQSDKEIGL